MKKYKSFNDAYKNILNELVTKGEEVTVRGLKVKEFTPYEFAIRNPQDRLLNLRCRKNMYRYIFGELLWYLSGCDSVHFIKNYARFWETISDDDFHSNSAYGKYIFGEMSVKGEGVNYDDCKLKDSQWEFCKRLLQKDPYTRQAIINIKPIQMYETKDTVCTSYMHFMIRDDKLDLHVGMRSNDVIRGTTYDVFMFTFLQELMACELSVKVGTYYHHVNSFHLYESDYGIADEILKEYEEGKESKKMEPMASDFREREMPSLLKIRREMLKLSKFSKDLLLLYLKGENFCD